MNNKFGVNHVHLDFDEIKSLGLKRIEICITAREPYTQALKSALKMMEFCEKEGITYSIHLPLFIYAGYDEDYLAAFFISSDESKRKKSFKLLKENIHQLKVFNPDFLVLHFPGVTENHDKNHEFSRRLNESLDLINEAAKKVGCKILLEYFGSNVQFSDYKSWVKVLEEYSDLGLLVDIGHLYFASINRGFDFYKALEYLALRGEAFHLWSVYGKKAYQSNAYYQKYHHIVPEIFQDENSGWGFDMKKVLNVIKKANKPAIVEASDLYKGHEHFIESITILQKYFSFSK